MEVVPEEADRGACGERREHTGVVAVERQRDDGERGRGDRADAGGKTVGPVGEVHDVHHGDDPDERERVAPVAQVDRLDERQRHVLDPHLGPDRDRRGAELSHQLDERVQAAGPDVVNRPDQRDGDRAGQDAARLLPGGQEEQRGHQRARPGSPGRRALGRGGRAGRARAGSGARRARGEPRCRRRDGERDHRGDEERPEGIELVHGAAA